MQWDVLESLLETTILNGWPAEVWNLMFLLRTATMRHDSYLSHSLRGSWMDMFTTGWGMVQPP